MIYLDDFFGLDLVELNDKLSKMSDYERNMIFNNIIMDKNGLVETTLLMYFISIYSHLSDNDLTSKLIYILKFYRKNINIKDLYGYSVLFRIISHSNINLLKAILDLYPDININITNYNNNNVLTIIVEQLYHNVELPEYNKSIIFENLANIINILLEKNIRIQYKLLKIILIYINYEYNAEYCKLKNINIIKRYYEINELYMMILNYCKNNNLLDNYVIDELYKEMIIENKLDINTEIYELLFSVNSNNKSATKNIKVQ